MTNPNILSQVKKTQKNYCRKEFFIIFASVKFAALAAC